MAAIDDHSAMEGESTDNQCPSWHRNWQGADVEMLRDTRCLLHANRGSYRPFPGRQSTTQPDHLTPFQDESHNRIRDFWMPAVEY